MKHNFSRYPDEFKDSAIFLVIVQGASINKVAEELNIARSTLQSWVKKYRQRGHKSRCSCEVENNLLWEENQQLKNKLEAIQTACNHILFE